MPHPPKAVTIIDPRMFDGTPYEVVGRAIRQTAALIALTVETMHPLRRMVLNAELERQMALGAEPDPDNSIQWRQLSEMTEQLVAMERKLEIIERAATYDPKHPPRA